MGDEPIPGSDVLFARQLRLQSEAAKVIMDLKLLDVLGSIGVPNPVGSLATGLMVSRDIDLTVSCERLAVSEVMGVGASLASHSRVRSVEFRNDSGSWNRDDSGYPDGLFLGVEYVDHVDDEPWELDIWFVTEPERQPDIAHVRELSNRLTDEHRAAILAIKHARRGRPDYSSFVVYRAVLESGVRSLPEFDAHMSAIEG